MNLFSFCDIPWWLTWLLPFLLGIALGWALWAKYKDLVADLEAKIGVLNGRIGGLEGELHSDRTKIADLEGDLAIANGKMREAEEDAMEWKAKASATVSSNGGADDSNALKTQIATLEAELEKWKHTAGVASATATVAGFAAKGSLAASKAETKPQATSPYSNIGKDNLQIVEGIGPKMEEVLKSNGISTFDELASKSTSEVKAILDKYGDQYKIIDPATWVAEAGLASSGKWTELIAAQKADGSDSKLEKYMISKGYIKEYKLDDLKIVEGVGPKIESLLHDAGIKTWRQLAETGVDRLKEILNAAGANYQMADPGTWQKQAELAADGKFDELRTYQNFLSAGKA